MKRARRSPRLARDKRLSRIAKSPMQTNVTPAHAIQTEPTAAPVNASVPEGAMYFILSSFLATYQAAFVMDVAGSSPRRCLRMVRHALNPARRNRPSRKSA